MRRVLASAVLYFLAIGVAMYAAIAYGFFPLGALVHPDMKAAFAAHAAAIYTHVFASIVALALGPFQFSIKLRQRHLTLHRWIGRTYLSVGVLVGGLAGLYMAQFAYGGVVSRMGFTALALAWLGSGVMAYRAIRRRDMANHRAWMVRNYALTFAAVTLRLYLPLALVGDLEFGEFYPVVAWLCWVPNLIWAEWFVRSGVANTKMRAMSA